MIDDEDLFDVDDHEHLFGVEHVFGIDDDEHLLHQHLFGLGHGRLLTCHSWPHKDTLPFLPHRETLPRYTVAVIPHAAVCCSDASRGRLPVLLQ